MSESACWGVMWRHSQKRRRLVARRWRGTPGARSSSGGASARALPPSALSCAQPGTMLRSVLDGHHCHRLRAGRAEQCHMPQMTLCWCRSLFMTRRSSAGACDTTYCSTPSGFAHRLSVHGRVWRAVRASALPLLQGLSDRRRRGDAHELSSRGGDQCRRCAAWVA